MSEQVVQNLELERELLAASGLFDEAYYLSHAGELHDQDPIGHYLKEGWTLGLQPNETFPGVSFAECFATLGFQGPPALMWITLQSAGWPIPINRADLNAAARQVRETAMLDDAYYRARVGKQLGAIDPAVHYVTVGERMGFAPSPKFDPRYYAERYPDVFNAGLICLRHYFVHGQYEGRFPSPSWECRHGHVIADPRKPNIILVVHETSRTGAPILGWNIALHLAHKYNIFTVRLDGGDLMEQFEEVSVEVHGPVKGLSRDEVEIKFALKRLFDAHDFEYAIVNSSESRSTVETFIRRNIPTLLLMHEFGSYVNPRHSLRTALDWSAEVVFPSHVVAHAAEEAHPIVKARRVHILPQGMSVLPAVKPETKSEPKLADKPEEDSDDLAELTKLHDEEHAFIVLGAGSVHIRKGVDLFLGAAAVVARSQPARPIKFLWVGHGYRPDEDMGYSVYLREQLNRSELKSTVTFLNAVSDLEPVYRIASAFFLSSRLDPMPNVSIDAAMRGIPVICFREASGTAELLLTDPQTADGVVEHLDAEAAGKAVLRLASDDAFSARMSEAIRKLAHTSFDMANYVAKLDAIGMAAHSRMRQRVRDEQTLLSDNTFDQDMFLGPSKIVETREATIIRYLALAEARGWDDPPVADTALRRPTPGFNPRIYFDEHPLLREADATGVDPLADYIVRDKPSGPWQTRVLRPEDPVDAPSGTLRIALHAHFFYPDLAFDFANRLDINKTTADLFVSTNADDKAKHLKRIFNRYKRGSVTVSVMPNKGRDIGPLLTGFAAQLENYDLIGHVHAKRSLFSGDSAMGDSWRDFLWQNLLGGHYPMLDRIAASFEQHAELGLVFPSDPHLIGWDENREQATELALRMGWTGALPKHFDFPLGTMFWMRRQALQPLFGLGLQWNDYPDEPIDDDGTILHALERLTPFANQIAGFRQAVTHIFGVSW